MLFHKIKQIEALDNLTLLAVFSDGTEKKYDVRQMFSLFPAMKRLEDVSYFNKVVLDPGGYGVSWDDEIDLDAEEIWDNGVDTGILHPLDVRQSIGNALATMRNEQGMTQKELSKITGIIQGDISKIENGNGNPSLSTLIRIAEGMGKHLRIDFV